MGSAAFVADERVDHFRQLFDVNVFGPLYAMQAAIPRMRQHGGGLIMNVSSGASRAAIPGLVAYGTSKAALDLVSNTARKELAAENIRIITIYPPNTATNAAKHMLGDPEFLRRSLEKAARAVMSPRTFAHRFRATLGASPYHWLLLQRIALAQRLLETTDEPIEHIATRCGFSSAATLRLHFRRFLGLSPQSYRNTFHSASA